VPVASAADLVVYKAIASRERDRSDIERLLELHGQTMNLDRVRQTVRELAEALERPELVSELELLVTRSGVSRPRGPLGKKRARKR
jgi:hypothetical protein